MSQVLVNSKDIMRRFLTEVGPEGVVAARTYGRIEQEENVENALHPSWHVTTRIL